MPVNEGDYQKFLDQFEKARLILAERLETTTNPALMDELTRRLFEMEAMVTAADAKATPPPDKGLAQLIGVGPDAAVEIGKTRIPPGVEPYDETVTSERVIAVGDLYYIYQHEKIGVFRVVQKLQELFRAGTVRLSAGAGAFA
ncbi:MAG TPA: hypothetical protein VNQ79_03140, partial [Blastocatellia bacterium]|nr:hypothetical protein [Blastocatellia bacterium]